MLALTNVEPTFGLQLFTTLSQNVGLPVLSSYGNRIIRIFLQGIYYDTMWKVSDSQFVVHLII